MGICCSNKLELINMLSTTKLFTLLCLNKKMHNLIRLVLSQRSIFLLCEDTRKVKTFVEEYKVKRFSWGSKALEVNNVSSLIQFDLTQVGNWALTSSLEYNIISKILREAGKNVMDVPILNLREELKGPVNLNLVDFINFDNFVLLSKGLKVNQARAISFTVFVGNLSKYITNIQSIREIEIKSTRVCPIFLGSLKNLEKLSLQKPYIKEEEFYLPQINELTLMTTNMFNLTNQNVRKITLITMEFTEWLTKLIEKQKHLKVLIFKNILVNNSLIMPNFPISLKVLQVDYKNDTYCKSPSLLKSKLKKHKLREFNYTGPSGDFSTILNNNSLRRAIFLTCLVLNDLSICSNLEELAVIDLKTSSLSLFEKLPNILRLSCTCDFDLFYSVEEVAVSANRLELIEWNKMKARKIYFSQGTNLESVASSIAKMTSVEEITLANYKNDDICVLFDKNKGLKKIYTNQTVYLKTEDGFLKKLIFRKGLHGRSYVCKTL